MLNKPKFEQEPEERLDRLEEEVDALKRKTQFVEDDAEARRRAELYRLTGMEDDTLDNTRRVTINEGQIGLLWGLAVINMEAGAGGVNAFQVVYVSGSDTILPANSEETSHLGRVIGLALENITEAETGKVQLHGRVENTAWDLTPGAVYWLGTGGEITTVVPTTGFIQRVGTAKNATTLALNFSEPLLI